MEEAMAKIPSWHEYFFTIMEAASLRSKDPETRVGAVIVDSNNRQIAMGYNGFPPGIREEDGRWDRPTKYDFVVHAEMNAIFNSHQSVKGCSVYLPFWPCKDCAKNLAAAGISTINILSDYYKSDIAELIFKESGINVVKHLTSDWTKPINHKQTT